MTDYKGKHRPTGQKRVGKRRIRTAPGVRHWRNFAAGFVARDGAFGFEEALIASEIRTCFRPWAQAFDQFISSLISENTELIQL